MKTFADVSGFIVFVFGSTPLFWGGGSYDVNTDLYGVLDTLSAQKMTISQPFLVPVSLCLVCADQEKCPEIICLKKKKNIQLPVLD